MDIKSDISGMSREELQKLLNDLKEYRAMSKLSRKHAHKMYEAKKTGIPRQKIQYFGDLNDDLKAFLLSTYKELFGSINEDSIEWESDASLEGGARMFYGDDLIDISLQDFENTLLS